MREIRTDKLTKLQQEVWIPAPPAMRYQTIANEVFGVPVDRAYGKIVEKKETGGIRLLPIPLHCQYPGNVIYMQEFMKGRGWKIDIENLPRSSLTCVTYTHAEKNIRVASPAMPEEDAVLFAGWVAHAMGELPDEMAGEYLREAR